MDGLQWKTLLKWMIWGYPYFWKHPNVQKSVMHIWNWFETHSAAFLMLHGRRSHPKKGSPNNRKGWHSDEEPGGCNKTCKTITDFRKKEMWYVIILIYLIMISDRWMVLYVQSCARTVTATHLVMGELCQKMCRKRKEPRRSQRNRTRSWKHACRLANIIQHSEVQN